MDRSGGLRNLEEIRDLEEIRQVKYRNLRCVDLKAWDEFGGTFTKDATIDYGTVAYGQPLRIEGRDDIVAFFRTKLGQGVVTSHNAGHPEIAVDGDTATGVWAVRDTMIATRHRVVITGAAFSEDCYRRGADGRWRIEHSGSIRTYEAMMSLADLPSLSLFARLDGAAMAAR